MRGRGREGARCEACEGMAWVWQFHAVSWRFHGGFIGALHPDLGAESARDACFIAPITPPGDAPTACTAPTALEAAGCRGVLERLVLVGSGSARAAAAARKADAVTFADAYSCSMAGRSCLISAVRMASTSSGCRVSRLGWLCGACGTPDDPN